MYKTTKILYVKVLSQECLSDSINCLGKIIYKLKKREKMHVILLMLYKEKQGKKSLSGSWFLVHVGEDRARQQDKKAAVHIACMVRKQESLILVFLYFFFHSVSHQRSHWFFLPQFNISGTHPHRYC